MDENLIIKARAKTPSINFDAQTGKLQILGYSLPENSMKFYKPVVSWVEKYIENPCEKTEIDIRLIILNTSSSKMFIDIFRSINKLVEEKTSEVSISWYYEIDDEDMHELAEQYKEICKATKFDITGVHHRLVE